LAAVTIDVAWHAGHVAGTTAVAETGGEGFEL